MIPSYPTAVPNWAFQVLQYELMKIKCHFKKKYFYKSMIFSSFIHLTEKGQMSKRKMPEVPYFISYIYNTFCVDKLGQRF